MSRGIPKSLLLAVIVHSLSACAIASDYLVDPTGSNFATGTSLAPWQTLQHAADHVGPGDVVTVLPGNYAGFQLETSGTLAAPIEFIANPGVYITESVPVRGDGINLEGASHIIIDGFHVDGMSHAGVRSVGSSDDLASHVTIRNVTATNNGKWGIFTGHVDDLLIEDNLTAGSLDEHGIYVSNSGDRPIIRNNIIFGNHGSGIHMNGDVSQGGDGTISNALVSGNVIYNNGLAGSGINMDGVQNSLIENNLIYDNHSSGISLYQIDAAKPASNNVIVNNTIRIADDGRWALNIQDDSTDNKIFNNVLISEHATRGAIDVCSDCRTGFVSDYNVVVSRFTSDGAFLSLAQWQTQSGQDLHSLVAIAANLFVNPSVGDYHLLPTSPARDAGTAMLAPAFDLDGNARPLGTAFDIGAYEFGAAEFAADYNQDGAVDAADYTVWRNNLGSSSTLPNDDTAGVDFDDYDRWKTNFGETNGAGGLTGAAPPVPEPAALALVAISIGLIARFRLGRTA
jgi:parallel beta-helix repeat protein